MKFRLNVNAEKSFLNGKFSYVYKVRVRYADVDKMGIVYNGNYLRYFEIGRTELMRSLGLPYKLVEEMGYLLPLIEAKIQWLGSAKYDDELEIHTAHAPVFDAPRIVFEYSIVCRGKEIAKGYTIHTFVRASDFKPVKPPSFFVEKLKYAIKLEE